MVLLRQWWWIGGAIGVGLWGGHGWSVHSGRSVYVCVCVHVHVCVCVRACVRACVRVCVRTQSLTLPQYLSLAIQFAVKEILRML